MSKGSTGCGGQGSDIAGLTFRWHRARRVIALAAILVLSLFTFEAGLHSAHHLTKANQPAQCVIASTSGHVTCAAVEAVAIQKPLNLVSYTIPASSPAGSSLLHLTPEQGRAPPFVIA
jgi:hypothetical protein